MPSPICRFVFFFFWTPELVRIIRNPHPTQRSEERSPLVELKDTADEEQPLLVQRSFDETTVFTPIHTWENNVRQETLVNSYPPRARLSNFYAPAAGMR